MLIITPAMTTFDGETLDQVRQILVDRETTDPIVEWTAGDFLATVLTVLWFSALASAIVDNIPLVIAMIPLLQSIIPVFGAQMGLMLTKLTTYPHTCAPEDVLFRNGMGAEPR